MASRHKRQGGWQIRLGSTGKTGDGRICINIGQMSLDEAKRAQGHIDHLYQCQRLGMAPSRITFDWLQGVSLTLHNRLAAKGLCEYRFEQEARTIKGLCDHFLHYHETHETAPSSIRIYKATCRILLTYFGAGRNLDTVTPADIDDLLKWIYRKGRLINGKFAAPLAPTTASRRCQTVKAIFHRAARKRWLETAKYYEMFERMPKKTRTDTSRRYWVGDELVREAIEHSLNNEQRLIFALARWGGIRIPSELLQITWRDIDRDAEKMLIRAPKQKNHYAKKERWIPIWPEIRPYLDQAYEEAAEGQIHVIAQYRSENTSAHSGMFCRACRRAGITKHPNQRPYPKIWVNMRSTRATELRKRFNPDVVDYWLNHSAEVSKAHYQQWETFDWR